VTDEAPVTDETASPDGTVVADDAEYAFATPPAPSRKLGAWALVLGLVPPVLCLLLLVLMLVLDTVDPWAALGAFLLGLIAIALVAFVTGVIAIVLGSLAARRNRGRGLGIAGIVLGALWVLGSLPVLPAAIGWIGSAFGA
jgi:hypothetical protein